MWSTLEVIIKRTTGLVLVSEVVGVLSHSRHVCMNDVISVLLCHGLVQTSSTESYRQVIILFLSFGLRQLGKRVNFLLFRGHSIKLTLEVRDDNNWILKRNFVF